MTELMTYIRSFDCFVVKPSVLMKANHKLYTGSIIFSLDINIVRKTMLYIYECVHMHVPVSASEMKSNSRTPSLCVDCMPNRTSHHHNISVITRRQCHKSRDNTRWNTDSYEYVTRTVFHNRWFQIN